MTYLEALDRGLISVETFIKMHDMISTDDIEDIIVGQKVTSSSLGVGTVISFSKDLPAIDIDFSGKINATPYPLAFISQVRFDDDLLQELISTKVSRYETALKWGADFDEPSCLYSLYLFRLVQNQEEEAFEYLCRAAKAGSETAQDCILGECSRRIEDNLNVDDETIQFALELYKKMAAEGDAYAPVLLADYYYVVQAFKTAESYLIMVVENTPLGNETRGEAAAQLASMYFTGKRGVTPDQDIFRKYQLAKKYFDIAASCGYPCDADLASVNRALGIEIRQNAMKKMAQKAIDANYSKKETYHFILSDLRREFAEFWDVLPRETQIDLTSGCMVYCDLYALGETICNEIDFSAAIIPIVKAAEVVFRKYICYGYLEYLLSHNISPNVFPHKHPLIWYNDKTKKATFRNEHSVEFTLGTIKHLIINPDDKVYPEFLAYAREIMGTKIESHYTLTDYLIRLSRKMGQITFNIRNPAAHSDIMPLWQAEICGNEIILVRKILKDFISKIDAV